MSATILHLNNHLNPNPADLIADFGHPQWPGWWIIMGLLIAVQCAMLFQSDITQMRPRPSGSGQVRIVRTVSRTTSARTGRTGRQLKTVGGHS